MWRPPASQMLRCKDSSLLSLHSCKWCSLSLISAGLCLLLCTDRHIYLNLTRYWNAKIYQCLNSNVHRGKIITFIIIWISWRNDHINLHITARLRILEQLWVEDEHIVFKKHKQGGNIIEWCSIVSCQPVKVFIDKFFCSLPWQSSLTLVRKAKVQKEGLNLTCIAVTQKKLCWKDLHLSLPFLSVRFHTSSFTLGDNGGIRPVTTANHGSIKSKSGYIKFWR